MFSVGGCAIHGALAACTGTVDAADEPTVVVDACAMITRGETTAPALEHAFPGRSAADLARLSTAATIRVSPVKTAPRPQVAEIGLGIAPELAQASHQRPAVMRGAGFQRDRVGLGLGGGEVAEGVSRGAERVGVERGRVEIHRAAEIALLDDLAEVGAREGVATAHGRGG